ncbi:hypothetical protein [uncultured Aquincola sp.]|uniref:hypothetical protein n=1 Tax=uncultured Aquincola sp. TaxID=886556 RepID=UPI0032B2081B
MAATTCWNDHGSSAPDALAIGERARAMAAASVRGAAQPAASGSGVSLQQRLSRLLRGSDGSR